ncbi:MAG: four helix bundle protein [Saprospiraceae bacterium]|nr:four helix bundle protein [Saprospiraceae bacterium]
MKISTYEELKVFEIAFALANKVFEQTKSFPRDEKYSLTDQIRRSSRSICANIAEAFSARKYEKSFVSKMVIAQCEATETQVWLKFALEYDYLTESDFMILYEEYGHIVAMIINMINNSDKWIL